jgi:hypothetical protein
VGNEKTLSPAEVFSLLTEKTSAGDRENALSALQLSRLTV